MKLPDHTPGAVDYLRIAFFGVLAAMTLPASAQKFEDVLTGRGMWIQAPKKFNARMVSRLQDMGVRRVHVMLTSSDSSTALIVP